MSPSSRAINSPAHNRRLLALQDRPPPDGYANWTAPLAPMEVRRGVDKAGAVVIVELQGCSRRITTKMGTAQVGTTSADGDTEIGRLVAQAVQKVGNEE
ncbi:MAG: hypothetical protein ACJ8AW_26915 [Rhodopila sp.]